jgi:RNA ligase (TIGR02306 family)
MFNKIKELFKKSQPEVVAEVADENGTVYMVPYTSILDIQPHGNAERLEVATVYGFQVIVSKGRYQVGDKAVYIPIDSILPEKLEKKIFPEDSKVKLSGSRVRQIKLRGLASQGMLIDPKDLSDFTDVSKLKDEQDLKTILGVKKYQPPVRAVNLNAGQKGQRNKKHENPLFHKYNGLDNIKWLPNKFGQETQVVIQEKLHGTNARASIMPYATTTLKRKILQLLRLAPKFENCYGSNNVEISAKTTYNGFYGEDVYGSVFSKIDVFGKLKFGEAVYGEIIGPGIQKGYTYGLEEHAFILFDVKVLQEDGSQKWLSPSEVKKFAEERGFTYVPVVYEGPFNKELAYSLTKGPSVFCPAEKIREGIVIKSAENYSVAGNKQALKWVSEDYLNDTTNTDEH